MSKIYVDEIAGIASADTVAIPGHVIQVVSMEYSSQTDALSSTWVDSGLELSITPSSTSSKILIVTDQNTRVESSWMGYRLLRDGTAVKQSAYVNYSSSGLMNNQTAFNHLDSPSTTSAVTYKCQFNMPSGTKSKVNDNAAIATMVLMEIAG